MKSSSKIIRSHFNAANTTPAKAKTTKTRRSPLTIRLSDQQWKELERASQGMSYGAYVKEQVFSGKRHAKRSAIQDYELLARILAALGQSDLFNKLDDLIAMSERSELNLTPEAEYELALACTCIIEMRDSLMRALGLIPKA